MTQIDAETEMIIIDEKIGIFYGYHSTPLTTVLMLFPCRGM